MSKIYKSLTQLVGNTPLLEVSNIERELDLKAKLIVKLEFYNPGGSVKDRIALAMIEDAEQEAYNWQNYGGHKFEISLHLRTLRYFIKMK